MAFKHKWDNYWYHYKWHTLAVLFAIALIVVLVKGCTSKKEPDLYMVYMSNSQIKDENIEKIKLGFAEDGLIHDINKDGETLVVFEHIVSTFNVNDVVDESTAGKLQTVLYGNQHSLMLVHKYALEDYDGMFENLNDKVQKGDKTFKSPSESFVTGISVAGNEYLEGYGINTKDLYVAMRRRSTKEKEKENITLAFDGAYSAFDYILKCQR